jgi:hypothetical protein
MASVLAAVLMMRTVVSMFCVMIMPTATVGQVVDAMVSPMVPMVMPQQRRILMMTMILVPRMNAAGSVLGGIVIAEIVVAIMGAHKHVSQYVAGVQSDPWPEAVTGPPIDRSEEMVRRK